MNRAKLIQTWLGEERQVSGDCIQWSTLGGGDSLLFFLSSREACGLPVTVVQCGHGARW